MLEEITLKVPLRFLMTKRPTEQSSLFCFVLCRWTHMDFYSALGGDSVQSSVEMREHRQARKKKKSVCKGNAFKTFKDTREVLERETESTDNLFVYKKSPRGRFNGTF